MTGKRQYERSKAARVVRCHYCRRVLEPKGSSSRLAETRDHVVPVCLGGTTTVACCFGCNQLKGDLTPDRWGAFMAAYPEWWKTVSHEPRSDGSIERTKVVIEDTLTERGKSYGEYNDGTQIAMDLYRRVQSGPSFGDMTPGQQYAMFMFCAKMARLLNGDPNHKDSWHDIAGYATLVHDRIAVAPARPVYEEVCRP